MNFVYKIYSKYDGFSPAVLPERLIDKVYLALGWSRYLDEVQKGDEVWVYFHGPHRFTNGVYLKGRVEKIDPTAEQEVLLRVHDSSTSGPLTDAETSERLARVVSARGRQVFFLPTEWDLVSDCSAFGTGESCRRRRCEWCPYWQSFHRIQDHEVYLPPRFPDRVKFFYPAYWAIPPRCYLRGDVIASHVHETSQILRAFKTGNGNLAYPFAKGIFEAVHECGASFDFDAIVPIPLSPDKLTKGEIHRTKLLADELKKLSGVPVVELMRLTSPVSKRRLISLGYTYPQFERRYKSFLSVSDDVETYGTILLVDDVSTYGGTIRMACEALWERNPDLEIKVATATQMIIKNTVRDESGIRA